jgi:hypothetical protein
MLVGTYMPMPCSRVSHNGSHIRTWIQLAEHQRPALNRLLGFPKKKTQHKGHRSTQTLNLKEMNVKILIQIHENIPKNKNKYLNEYEIYLLKNELTSILRESMYTVK